MNNANVLPESGYVRLSQILGDKQKGIPPIIPICKTAWYRGIREGRFPKPVKLGNKVSAWRVTAIRALLEQGIQEPEAQQAAQDAAA